MDIRKLQNTIVEGLEDVKAQDIVVFNTEHLSPLFERVIVATGNTNRQTKALASSVREAVKKAGFDVMRTEGEDNAEWIIVDCGAVVAHIMQPAIRQYYQLEEIWGEKPVAIQRRAARTGLVKASEPMEADGAKPAKKQAATKKAAAKKAVARKPAAEAEVSRKPAAKKAPAKKVAAKKVVAKKVAAKKVVAKKAATLKKVVVNAPAKKVAAKKVVAKKAATVKRVAAKKVVAKKAAAKKAPARK